MDHEAAPIFVVLDGAQFDNLPEELMMGGFVSRSLYLDRGANNPEQIITAPHMVWLDERPEKMIGRPPRDSIPALMELVAGRPAAVFWQCPEGAEALYKHLRGINMVLIPREFLPTTEPELAEQAPVDRATHEAVLFRHADANAIAQLIPALDISEANRLYGPATKLMLAPHPEWANGRNWLEAERPNGLPPPPPGMLLLSTATLGKMRTIREGRSLKRTSDFLRRNLPRDFQNLSDRQLAEIAVESRRTAQDMGIRSLGGHQRWAYLMAITEGRVAEEPSVRKFIQAGHQSPDRQVKLAMLSTLERMKQVAAEIEA